MAPEPVLRLQPPKTQTKKNNPPPPSLRGRALRLLGRRELSRQELEGKLRRHADPEKPDELAALLDDLAERGWLSDARYAAALVRKRTGNFARSSIGQELKRAGVDEEVTAAALAQHPEIDPDEEFAAALALCRRKFRRAPANQKEKARQIRFLQSRGYSLSLVLRVLKHRGDQNENSGE